MENRKRLLTNIACVFAFSVVGATIMMWFDDGGTRWLKFILYLFFFASISSPAIFSSNKACSLLMGRSRGRS
jgi:hypothetical protein